MKDLIILCFLILALFIGGIFIGGELTKSEYLRRAKELPDDIECYSNQDIEHILYNQPLNN